MYKTAVLKIIDPINNTLSTPIVINNVVEDVLPLPLLLVGKEDEIVEEPFEVEWVVGFLLRVDSVVVIIGLSVIVTLFGSIGTLGE